jgi:hypothetical protein
MPLRPALYRVVTYAIGVALLGICILPFPIIEIMGGLVHLSEAERAVRSTSQIVVCCGGPIFVLAFLAAIVSGNQIEWRAGSSMPPADGSGISWPLRFLMFASIAVWAAVLPITQPEQQLRREVEQCLVSGRIPEALQIMSAHTLDDFPPQWEPPPRYLKGESNSLTLDIWNEILQHESAPWVRSVFLEKLKEYMNQRFWSEEKLADILNRLAEGEALNGVIR